MNESNQIQTNLTENGLLLANPEFQQPDKGQWIGRFSSSHSVLLRNEVLAGFSKGLAGGHAGMSIEMFHAYILTLVQRKFTGAVTIEIEDGLKVLYFRRGHFIFASSSQIDDRLGEVCYRENVISLDALLNTSVQVNKTLKFGQALLRDKILSNVGISKALKMQVLEIARSVFWVKNLYFELQPDVTPVSEVLFLRGEQQIFDDFAATGAVFRSFVDRISDNTMVYLNEPFDNAEELASGTYLGDLASLIKNHCSVAGLIDSSKLCRTYTLFATLKLFIKKAIRLDPFPQPALTINDANRSVAQKIDAYHKIAKAVYEGFQKENKAFPIRDTESFLAAMSNEEVLSYSVDQFGFLDKEAIFSLLQQAQILPERAHYLGLRLESLSRFIVQIAQDNLAEEIAKQAGDLYKEAIRHG